MLPALHRGHATAQIVGNLLPRFETCASVIVSGRLDRRRIGNTAIAMHFDGWFLAHSNTFTPSLPTRSRTGRIHAGGRQSGHHFAPLDGWSVLEVAEPLRHA